MKLYKQIRAGVTGLALFMGIFPCGAQSNLFIRPGLIADRTGQIVRITATTTSLKANDPVEFPLITRDSGKDYEALAVSQASALDIHESLRFIGLEPGRGVDPTQLRFWPKGDRVKMVFHVADTRAPSGPILPLRVEHLIQDTRTGKTLPETGLVFTGSEWVPAGDQPTGKVYAADAFGPGSIASVSWMSPASLRSMRSIPSRSPTRIMYFPPTNV
jgi:hypothetical protein